MRILVDQIKAVLSNYSVILENEANVLYLKSDVYVIGDIHGYFSVYSSQFYDLLNIFEKYGSSTEKQYLFLGDYVDRGQFSIEVITLLFFLKLENSKKVHLLRGQSLIKDAIEHIQLQNIMSFTSYSGLSKYNQ